MPPLIFVDRSEVRPGKLAELKAAIAELAGFVEANEPRPLYYEIYLNESATQMTVVQMHPDSASMEEHMELAAPVFRRFADLVTLRRMDVFGEPSEEVLTQIRAKVALLGGVGLVVHRAQAGFSRTG